MWGHDDVRQTPDMRVALTIRDRDGLNRDVVLVSPPGATLDGVAAELGAYLGTPALPMWNGATCLPPGTRVGDPGLARGDAVSLTAAKTRDFGIGAVLRLHVVGGPDAGLIAALPRGVSTVGRARGCDFELSDPDVSRQHVSITVTSAGICVRDLGSTNGATLDGQSLDPDGSPLLPGQLLRLGDSLLSIAVADEPAAAVHATGDGVRSVNRPPRPGPSPIAAALALPALAARSGPQRVQWFGALVPAIAGGVLAIATHNVQFLGFVLLSPLVVLGTAAGDRLHWRRSRRRDAASFDARSTRAASERRALLDGETRRRRRAHPDPAAVLRTAFIPDCRLWERRRTDEDALDVRLGLSDGAANARVRDGAETRSAGTVQDVPQWVDLRAGPLGIAGPRGIALGSARWAVAQLATLHSPNDLDLAVLLSDEAAPAWTWARWLPHLDGRIADTSDRRQEMVTSLLHSVDERVAHHRGSGGQWTGRWLVLLLDRVGERAELPGLAKLLAIGPSVGITAVCVDDEERQLPTACTSVARVAGETGTRLVLRRAGDDRTSEIVQDRVSTLWAERVARALASLEDAGADRSSTIPDYCRLPELVGLVDLTPFEVAALWQRGGSLRIPLGVAADGPLTIDLAADGPHALVAGTTGSGKSELLQTLVLALALINSPQAVAFVLIDYKGGAAFAECARLPHTVGLVTDLDPHSTRRALQSLEAEIRRREALFAEQGAVDLTAYHAADGTAKEVVTRLVLVVDEFATLAEELPDFVSGLVAIAQRGRSLGIHLVLATQRPGGVISPEIRANTALRIALRVTDPAESCDVIGTDQAARIDTMRPGRAFVRTGSSLHEMQTARVGMAIPADIADVTVIPLDEWARAPAVEEEPNGSKTERQTLVDAIREASYRDGISAPRRPWLPELPDRLPLDRIATSDRSTVEVGLIDLPARQLQEPLLVDLDAGGPLLVVGTARSGRSTATRTIAARAADCLGPEALQVFVLDCAGGGLHAVAELPHCRAMVTHDDMPTADRLLQRLGREMSRRQEVIATRPESELPHLLLLVDGWEGLAAASAEYDTGRTADTLLALMRDASSARMTVVLSGDRGALAPRIAGHITRRFILRLADRADFAAAGVTPRSLPHRMPPGRAVRADDGAEVQFGFVGDSPEPAEQAAAMAQIAARHASTSHVDGTGIRVAPLPVRVHLGALVRGSRDRIHTTVLGLGGDAAQPVAVDLFVGDGRWLIAGPPRSGRTTLLISMLRQAATAGTHIIVAAPRRSRLGAECDRLGITLLRPDEGTASLPSTDDRPLLVLVDDSEDFLDTPTGDALTVVAKAAPAGFAFVAAGRTEDLALTYRGIAAEVRRSRTGVLIGPAPGDGDLLGVRLPRTRYSAPPGRGVLICDQPAVAELPDGADVLPIQIALP